MLCGTLEILSSLASACEDVPECQLAGTEITIRVGLFVADNVEAETVIERKAEARLAPTLDAQGFLTVLDTISRVFEVTGIWASEGEIALALGGQQIQEALNSIASTAKILHSILERSVVIEARSAVSDGWHSWRIGIYTCEPIECEDSPREIAEASAASILRLFTGLGINRRISGDPSAKLLNPLHSDKFFVCAGLVSTTKCNRTSAV